MMRLSILSVAFALAAVTSARPSRRYDGNRSLQPTWHYPGHGHSAHNPLPSGASTVKTAPNAAVPTFKPATKSTMAPSPLGPTTEPVVIASGVLTSGLSSVANDDLCDGPITTETVYETVVVTVVPSEPFPSQQPASYAATISVSPSPQSSAQSSVKSLATQLSPSHPIVSRPFPSSYRSRTTTSPLLSTTAAISPSAISSTSLPSSSTLIVPTLSVLTSTSTAPSSSSSVSSTSLPSATTSIVPTSSVSTSTSTSTIQSSSSSVSSAPLPSHTTSIAPTSSVSTSTSTSTIQSSNSGVSSAPLPSYTTSAVPTSSLSTSTSTAQSSGSSDLITTQLATSASPTLQPYTSTPTSLEPTPTGKRGLVAGDKEIPDMIQYDKITWNMNWWEGAPPTQPDKWLFVPQLTHFQPDQWWETAGFRQTPEKFKYIAGFLEPNVENLSISDAVESWKTNLEPLSSTFTLIPPMVGQNGLDWLGNFTEACSGCSLDSGPIAFTVYVSPDDGGVSDFKNHVQQFMAAYPGRELWVANIGVLGTASASESEWLMRQLLPYLDGVDIITRYGWNGGDDFWDGAALTPLAELYATL